MKTAFWIVLNVSVGILILAFCLFISDAGQNAVASILSKNMPISEESKESFENWKNPPLDTIYNFYLFHVDNAEEVLKTGAKPKLVEKGPFCYRNHNFKRNITFHEDRHSVEFVSHTQYIEDDWEGRNCQDLEMTITQFNVPYAIIMKMLSQPSYETYRGLLMMMAPADWGLFITKSARELIWKYEDPVFKMIKNFGMLPIAHYGHFIGMNNSDSKFYEVGTGADNIRNYGRINKWNNWSDLKEPDPPVWRSDYANQISGTDGGAFSPLLNKNERVYVFLDSMCRSLDFEAAEGSTMLNEVETWAYTLSLDALDSSSKQNRGFCIGKKGKCPANGTLSISSCINATVGLDLPLVMSKPHFLHGDDMLSAHFEGLKPDPIKHQTTLYAEPMTGTVLKAEKNLQTNIEFGSFAMEMAFDKNEDALAKSSLKDGFLAPLYFVNQAFDPHLHPELLDYVHKKITGPLALVSKWPIYLLAVGVLGNFIAFIMGLIIHRRERAAAKTASNNAENEKEHFIS